MKPANADAVKKPVVITLPDGKKLTFEGTVTGFDIAKQIGPGLAKAALAAAKLLEPKTQHVHLTSPTLKTETDIRDWLAQTKAKLVEKLKDGPIVIS